VSLTVNEIFYSIQGESLHAGRPCVFVRLGGCNLRCRYCDTRYAYEEGYRLGIHEIMDRIADYKCPLIEITGGEPLFQKETPLLIQKLLECGYEMLMETNGSYDIDWVDRRCIRIVDIKCPSSGESAKTDLDNLKRLTPQDQVKFVIGDRNDYDYAAQVAGSVAVDVPRHHILFSPVFNQLNPRQLAQWLLRDRFPARLHLQLHKFIWPDIDRGK